MDFRRLSYFVAVADNGTVSAAARELHISQPPLSFQIQLLEQELGCTLFDRASRRMRLTEAGRVLYERAVAILHMCKSAESELKDLSAGFSGTIRMGAVSSTGNSVFLGWLKKYHELYPCVHFELFEANTYQLIENIRSKRIELAFVRTPFSASDMKTVPLGTEKLCAVWSENFVKPWGETVTMAELEGVPLIIYRRWERILRDEFQAQGISPDIFVVSDDARTTVKLAEEGFGVGIVPESAVTAPYQFGVRVGIIESPALKSDICIIYPREGYVSAPAKRFLDMAEGKI